VIVADVVDGHALVQVIWVSLVAGVGLVAAASLGIAGVARANAERRDGRALAASIYLALAALAGLVCAGGVALGVSVMLSKS
jgi:hypothetical protein